MLQLNGKLRFKQTILVTLLLVFQFISSAQLSANDCQIYAAIIKTEIGDRTKSVAIIKNSIDSKEKNESTYNKVDQYVFGNVNYITQSYFWENDKGERLFKIDSSKSQYILDFCKSEVDQFVFTNCFSEAYKTVILKKYPIRRKSIEQDWNHFYEKYPDSGGIFSFSRIKFYAEESVAVIYYWVRRGGLNGHGGLAVMTKTNGEWQIECKSYLWNN